MSTDTISLPRKILVTVLLALVLWLPRGFALDRFVAIDERTWLNLSGNFYTALRNGDLANTYQSYHPGVTVMWAGTAGFLWEYPSYAADVQSDASGRDSNSTRGISDFLRQQGHSPLEILAAARSAIVLFQVALLLIAFWLAVSLLGWLAASVGFLLIAYAPFTVGLSRILHVDAMGAALMLVSILALLHFQRRSRSLRILMLSATMAGLAWLTRSPTFFLAPFAALFLTLEWFRRRAIRGAHESFVTYCIVPLLIWGGGATLVFVALWPAMWANPIGNVSAMLDAAFRFSEAGHNKPLFFDGESYTGDPGFHFYPVTYLWRTTPVTLIGLLLALLFFVRQLSPAFSGATLSQDLGSEPASRATFRDTLFTASWLTVYGLLFLLFMTLGDKKFPRYLLPVYYSLDLLAGLGWAVAASWLVRLLTRRASWTERMLKVRWAPLLIVTVPFALQAGLALQHFPYYFTYYNPLLGGGSRAPQVMPIGLGEGLDEAARYLLEKPNAETLTVATWYEGGSFNYIFPYDSVDIEEFYRADYGVIYAHQWQRNVPSRQMLDYFASLTPVHTVTLHGIDYAWVYDLRTALPPTYFTDWAGAIRLVETELVPGPVMQPGDELVVRSRLYTLDTLDRNLNAVVRLVDAAGREVGRSEGWPFGSATSTWQPGDVYVDGHTIDLPTDLPPGYLRIELGFYDAEAQTLLTPTVAGTSTPRADLFAASYVGVGLAGYRPPLWQTAPVLGDEVALAGAALDGVALDPATPLQVQVSRGAAPELTVAWQPLRPLRHDYTTLLHLVGPDGVPIVQWDQPPLQDVAPATIWREGDLLVDRYALPLPDHLAPGTYRLLVGLYDLATLERLPVAVDDAPAGDTVHLTTLRVD